MDKIRQNLKESYNKNYDKRMKLEMSEWKINEIEKFMLRIDPEETKVLDLGAGTGVFAEIFSQNNFDVTCADLSTEMINICRKKGLKAKEMDFYSLDFPAKSFSAVWSINALLHVPKAELGKVLLEVERVMTDGAIFYLGLYGGKDSEGIFENDNYDPKRFFSLWKDEDLKEFVSRYFEIVSFRSFETDYPILFQSLVLKKI
jgi:ubiquinone/menaquinone biosynthesis C-methylase UbiE